MWKTINDILNSIDNFVWGVPLMVLIIAGGILLTVRLGVLQVRKLPLALKWMIKNEEEGEGEITSFAALCTALSATIGTGNIVGVATAVCTAEILNRRKYPRLDLSNDCTIHIKKTNTTFNGKLDNISANGFAFLTKDPYFVDNKGAQITISIDDFELPDHSVLDGYVIRCSNNEGTYIVGCQMPEDNYYIQTYVDEQLHRQTT